MKSINYPEINHDILLVTRDHEILIITPDGREVASLTVVTMEKHEKNENGKDNVVPSENFWVQFKPKYDRTGLRDSAEVIIES